MTCFQNENIYMRNLTLLRLLVMPEDYMASTATTQKPA
jgi:hypothetical protein